MCIKRLTRWILGKAGYTIIRTPPVPARKRLFDAFAINVVLDVGANVGLYAMELRGAGYKGRIVSFEPLSSAYSQLLVNSQADASWETFNIALGDKDGEATINIAGNSSSSSILGMLPVHVRAAPESHYVGQEQVMLTTLDSIIGPLRVEGGNVWLKIDTQGFEEKVLQGASQALRLIDTLQIEMSLIPLYQGERLFPEMYAFLAGKGYQLVSLELGFEDPQTGRLLQVDGIFHRY